MPDATVLLIYLAVIIGFVVFPGPSILLIFARATSSGTRVGLATSIGIGLGDVIHTLLAVVGVSAIVIASAEAFVVIRLLGAGYLVYIGVRTLMGTSDRREGAPSPAITPRTAFRQACLAEVLNPKTAMFFLAFLPQFVSAENGAIWSQLLVLGLLFVGVGTCATGLVALFAGAFGQGLRRYPLITRWQGRVVGGLYCALGIRQALQPR